MANRTGLATAVSAEVFERVVKLARADGVTPSAYVRALIAADLARKGEVVEEAGMGRRLSVKFQIDAAQGDFARALAGSLGLSVDSAVKRAAVEGLRARGMKDDEILCGTGPDVASRPGFIGAGSLDNEGDEI